MSSICAARPAAAASHLNPWAWLRGFAYFLLAWPLLSLLALDQLDLDDWQSVLIAVLGPAGIGLSKARPRTSSPDGSRSTPGSAGSHGVPMAEL